MIGDIMVYGHKNSENIGLLKRICNPFCGFARSSIKKIIKKYIVKSL